MMRAIKNWVLIKSFHLLAKVDEPFYGPLNRFMNFLMRIRHPERIRHLGELHPDKTFYVIRDFAETVGLAGWYDRALGYLDRAERKGWIPVIDAQPPAQADDGDWYAFFKGASPYPIAEVMQSRNVVFATVQGMIYKRHNPKNVARRHLLAQKIPVSDAVRSFLDERLEPLFEGMPRPIVAVRYRGTDYRVGGSYCPTGHAKVPREDLFCDVVEADLRRWGVPVGEGEHVFVVTEEQESLDKIRKRFPKCRFVEKERYADFKPGKYLVYCRLPTMTPKMNNFMYLLEIFAMARCDYLIGGVNGGVLMALNLNGNRYRGIHVLKTGVN